MEGREDLGIVGSGILRECSTASREGGPVAGSQREGRPHCCLFGSPFSCTHRILTLFRGHHPHPKG